MDEAALVQRVLQVLRLLQQQPEQRKVLVLFSGASAGQRQGVETVAALRRAGHRVTVALSGAAAQMLDEATICQQGAAEIIKPGQWVDSPRLVRSTDLVLIPTLSMNLAASLANASFDGLLSTLALGALLAGKPVIAVRDGADPEGCGGRVWGAVPGAAALRARLSGHLKTLESYGITLVHDDELLPTVQQRLLNAPTLRPTTSHASAASAGGEAPRLATAVITQADIAHLAEGALLRIPKGSKLTPLAHETAGRLMLRLDYEA
jgi:hypothetical protein